MSKFMINICYGNLQSRKDSSHHHDDSFIMEKYQQWSEKLASKTLAAHKLKDGEGRKVEMDNGKITDGPYTETKESIGGFYLVEAESYEEAVKMAEECPTLLYQGGYVEVREVEF